MKSAPLPENENERLALLNELDILDTLEEQSYDDLTKVAAVICDSPIALISLIDEERQWFKSHHGLDARETPRSEAFCSHAILQDSIFQIPDSAQDDRFHDNPLATGAPHVKFYAGTPLKLRDNLRVGTLCVIDSKAKNLSEAQLEALSALGRQVEAQLELRLKIKELKALDAMKTEFIAMVSHELRTPLTSIYGSLSILNSGVLNDQPEKMASLLKTALNNSNRLQGIVNDILDLTKLESSGLDINKEPKAINETIKTALSDLASYLNQCAVTVKLELGTDLPIGNYDEGRIIQVVNNLVSNAAKFSENGSEITIRTSLHGDCVRIEVADQGQGIPEDKHDQVFERFSSMSLQGSGKLPGTGLGLNISRELVRLHNGEIWFESQLGVGSTFFVELPIDSSAAA